MDSNNIFQLFKADAGRTFKDLFANLESSNGFMREKAAIRLGELGDPAALPYLMERANDWVPQVRKAAYDAILRLQTRENASAFITSLPALVHLEGCLRADHKGLINRVQDFLCADESRAPLIEAMSADDPTIARIVCRLVIQRNLLAPIEMLRKCLSSEDVLVRSLASCSLQTLDLHDFNSVLGDALSDRFMPVRREAFQQLLIRDRARGLIAARSFLLDRNASMREIAVAQLLRDGVDVPALYDESFARELGVRKLVCVIWAWGHLKQAARIDDIKRFTTHSSSTIRRTALQTLTKLIGSDAEKYLIAGLSDSARSVCATASRLVIKSGVDLPTELLASIARSNRAAATAACCNVAAMRNKWSWLLLVLDLYGDEKDAASRNYLLLQLHEWNWKFNNAATQPSHAQVALIVQALRKCAGHLEKKLFAEISFALKVYGGAV